MFFVYQLQSINRPTERYTGFTENIDSRLAAHNNGQSPHTSKHKPWQLVNYFAFSSKETAKAFEAYLKSGSGRAFTNKHLWPAISENQISTRSS